MTASSKLQVSKIKYGYQIKKKVQFQKLMQPALTLTSFHYIISPGMLRTQTFSLSVVYTEPWNIQKFDGI